MAGPIRIAILANGGQAKREIAGVTGSVTALGRVSGKLGSIAGVGGLAAVTAGAVGLVKSAVDVEKQFSQTFSLIQANSGATQGALAKLNDQAIQLGQDTAFSANDAADAMLELSKAGLSVKTIYGGGVAGTLTLAAAGGTDLATAATIGSNALNAFNLQGSDMAKVAAAIAGGANASSASVESLGLGLAQTSAGAVTAGLSLNETVAALSAFDAAGIKGSDAGTSLKTMLQRLIPVTVKQQQAMEDLGLDFVKGNGQFESLTNIAGQLHDILGPLTQAQRQQALTTLFGSDASRAAAILTRQGADGIRKYIRATQDQNAAQDLAKARMSGTAGALERLSGTIETAKLRLGQELAPTVQSVADSLGKRLVPTMDAVIDGGKDVADAIGPAVGALKDLVPSGDAAGGVFSNVIVPGLRAASDIIVPVAHALDALPGPLKTIAAEGALAAFVLPKLVSGFDSVSSSAQRGLAALSGVRREIVQAATGVPQLQVNLERLGASARNVAVDLGQPSAKALELRSAMQQVQVQGGTTTSVLRGAGKAAAKLAEASKTAAGVGGMLALADSTKRTSKSFGALEGAAGGALLGFSVGGPWGAAIGGGAGALLGLWSATKKSNAALEAGKKPAIDYASSLDQVTGAATKATRELVYNKLATDGTIYSAGQFGISARTVVDAVLGQEGALRKVTAAVRDNTGATTTWTDQYGVTHTVMDQSTADAQKLAGAIGYTTQALKDDVAKTRERALATGNLAQVLKGVPKDVRTEVGLIGSDITRRQIARLTAEYNLTPKQVRTIIRATGAETTQKAVRRVAEDLKAAGKITVHPDIKAGVQKAANDAKGTAQKGGRDIVDALEDRIHKARADMPQLRPSVNRATNAAAAAGRSGGQGIGTSVKQGFPAGFAGADGLWSAQVRGAVASAIAAGRAAARAHSPSEATRDLGHDLMDGLELGVNERSRGPSNAFAKQLRSLILGNSGSDQINEALDKLRDLIEKRVNLKDNKAERAREKAILDHLEKQFRAYRKIGQQQDALKDGNYLKYLSKASALYQQMTAAGVKNINEAREALANLKQQSADYQAAIASAFSSYGNVTGFGLEKVTTKGVLDELRKRADNAEEYERIILQLKSQGLDQATVQQLIDAGPEQGLAYAKAILQGGSAAITEINALESRVNASAQRLGSTMANSLYAAGIAGAQGLVDGLNAQESALDKVARKLARQIVKAVKDELGIKSPSRVMAGVMGDVQRGLGVGVDDVYVRRQGARIAKSVVTGFGTPALEAYATANTATGAPFLGRILVDSVGLHEIERGRSYVADIQAYKAVGGTS